MISVIVPIYNIEKLLPLCINSIIKQTYTNFELILVNDGSPDKCGDICDRFAEKDSRIKVIHKQNGGLSSARNEGIQRSIGDYLAFVDSDDVIHPKMLEVLFSHASKYSSDIVLCDYSSFSEQERSFIGGQKDIQGEVKHYTNIESLQNIYSNKGGNFIVAWNKLYKKDLFRDLKFEEGRIFEDEFLAHKILYKCHVITYVPIVLYYYFQRDDSIMGSSITVKKLKDAIAAYEDRIKFFEEIEQSNLRDIEEKGFIKGFLYFYLNAKKDNPSKRQELKRVKRNFHSRIRMLLSNPLFNKRKKVMWTFFILFPRLYEWGLYVNRKLQV